ncbi:MAG: tyrosine--tRNA ligase [Nanoarchaeota archaeon]|nr:tyrosine--tRNA ligase [Nanoarchaeota archaeon]
MELIDKFNLVKQNTVEILTEDELKELLESKKNPTAYWGIAPTGPVHMGYLATMGKIFDFMKAGIKTKILIADIHAALDDLKAPWGEIEKRREYVKKCLELAIPWEKKPEFVFGSDYELSREYQADVLKMASITTVKRAMRAASEVTRMKNPKVSELIYPIMQSLDEEYLGVDIQLGGIDQRHILAFAREYLPKLGYKARVEVMTPLIVSLKGPGVKMSASIPETSIKVHDSEEAIREKIKKAYCPAGEVKDNPILQLFKYVVFPIRGSVTIERPEKFGGNVSFEFYEDLERMFKEKELHPLDVKAALTNELVEIFSKVRNYFEKHKDELKELGEQFV